MENDKKMVAVDAENLEEKMLAAFNMGAEICCTSIFSMHQTKDNIKAETLQLASICNARDTLLKLMASRKGQASENNHD